MPQMIGKELNDEMNKQIVEELHSAYIYMGMAEWAQEQGLHNFANFMKTHAETEEYKHAMKIVKYIRDAGGKVEYGAIGAASTDFKDVETVLNVAVKHEQHITARIKLLYELALGKKEYYALEMLEWFLKEQMEEENLFEELLRQFDLNGKRVGLWDHHVKHP